MSIQIDQQLSAVNSASSSVRRAHLTLLVFLVYAGITVWSTTHEQLLVGSGVALPLLTINVPIISFAWITPLFLLVLHFNVMLQVMLLSSKLRGLDEALTWATNSLERRRELLRLDTFSITQWLSGHDESWITRAAVAIAYFTSLYVLPVALLLWLLLKLLPAHHSGVTTGHGWAICVDLVLLWLFWWKVQRLSACRSENPQWISKRRQVIKAVIFGLSSILVVFFSFEIAVAPKVPSWWITMEKDLPPWLGGWSDKAVRSVPRSLHVSRRTLVAVAPSPEVLAAYHQRGESIDSAWLQHARGLDLTDRDLRFADFERSRLWNADFRGARLNGAIFTGAELRGVLFTTREPQRGGPVLYSPAELPEADFSLTSFPKGDLYEAFLDYSELYRVSFPGADLRKAKLRGVQARYADLRGAALAQAEIQDADFLGADLRGADLRGANMQAADFNSARLQGADLRGAKLQGVNFRAANLQGADLRGAMVFGTKFDEADLTLTDLRGVTLSNSSRDVDDLIGSLQNYRPYTPSAWVQYNRMIDKIKSRLLQGGRALSLEKVRHQDAIFDHSGVFLVWGDPINEKQLEIKLLPALISLACGDEYIAKGLLWEWGELDRERLLPRALLFNTLSMDPILKRRSAVLIESLETRKCRALQTLSGPTLVELEELVKQPS